MMTPLELVAAGFAVVEVAALTQDGTRCSCRLGTECPAAGKHPIGKAWSRSALGHYARGYRRGLPPCVRFTPLTSYGLLPVPGSRVLVIDRDDDVPLPLPPTFEVRRASAPPWKGHFYGVLCSDIDESDVPRSFAGGEVRIAASGFVVGPSCRHASGDLYLGNDIDVATFDRELVEALRASPPVRRNVVGIVEAVEGSRHYFLVSQARKFAGWGRDVDELLEELLQLNETVCDPPLDDAEVSRIAEWAGKSVKADPPVYVRRRSKPNPWAAR